jgi:arabinofuranosyltransferase
VATTAERAGAAVTEDARPRRRAPVGVLAPVRRRLPLVLLLLPAVVVLAGAWNHRWVDEDGFINLRVVDQIFAGHGPVFNEGERVEATTSPLWILALVLGRLTLGLVLKTEWVAVLLGVAAATTAFALGAAASRRLHPGPALVVPLGLLMVAAVPVVWDYATAGLEMGLVWLWLAGCWWVLVDRAVATGPPSRRARRVALVVLGLGPLVRPDLVLVAAIVLVAWVVLTRPSPRQLLADATVALAVPVAYEVFRMGYYASPVPNTGLAKGAASHYVFAGVDYLEDLGSTYGLWVPLLPLLVALAIILVRGRAPVRVAVGAMVASALVHGAYIVYIGGDYMHGRLLLPALFALGLPASLALERRILPLLAVAVGVGWAVLCAGWLRFEHPAILYVELPPITDRRHSIPADERVVRKRTIGEGIDAAHDAGARGVLFPHLPGPIPRNQPMAPIEPIPGGNGKELITFEYTIGVLGYQAGPDVRVVDLRGLADPLSARAVVFQAWRLQAGHRKFVSPNWYAARFGFPFDEFPTSPEDLTNASAYAAARRALACPPLSDLLDAITEPLTPGRFLSNIWHSPSYAAVQVPEDPRDAEGADCGT